jgi:AraC family transcriptional regulator
MSVFPHSAEPQPLLSERRLAAGEGWSLTEFICRAGPDDRPFEERHEAFSVAAVLSGQFAYRGDNGGAYLAPGALLTGNSGRCFRCAHEHGAGDRCVSLSFSGEMAGEVAAAVAGRAAFAFERASAPPSDATAPIVARFAALAEGRDVGVAEDVLWSTLERIIVGVSGRGGRSAAPDKSEARRVAAAIRAIDDDPTEEHGLDGLARAAGLSRYHFLRLFRRATGATPHQFLIQTRLRRAALRIAGTREPIISIALESGFGDLSTFNRRFRAVFGASPRRFRAGA